MARDPGEAAGLFVEWGTAFRSWSSGHALNVTRQLKFWRAAVPLQTWADFAFLAARVEVIAGRVHRGMSVDGISTDSNEDLRVGMPTLRKSAGALVAWARWLANAKRRLIAPENLQDLLAVEWPRVRGANADIYRRPFSESELKALLWVSPPARKLLYWVAVETGYRASELRRLVVEDFDGAARALRLKRSQTKNGKQARQVLSEALCAKLMERVAVLGAGHGSAEYSRPVAHTPLLDVPAKCARAIYSDLKAAAIDHDDRGRGRLDFHSLRGSHAALRFAVGGKVNEVQASMRHADPALTMHYAGDEEQRQRELGELVAGRLFQDPPNA